MIDRTTARLRSPPRPQKVALSLPNKPYMDAARRCSRRWPNPVRDSCGHHDNAVRLSFRGSGARPARAAMPRSGMTPPPFGGVKGSCRRGLVRTGGLEPPRAMPDGFSYPLRFSPPPATLDWAGAFGVWTIPSPCHGKPWVRCCPSSLYTFRSAFALRLGSGLPVERFPRI